MRPTAPDRSRSMNDAHEVRYWTEALDFLLPRCSPDWLKMKNPDVPAVKRESRVGQRGSAIKLKCE
jgi:hypothetical protein